MKKYKCLSSADLHGNTGHYEKIKRVVKEQDISFVFFCGDLLPKTGGSWHPGNKIRTIQMQRDFIKDFFLNYLKELGKHAYVYAIFGNDDFKSNYPLIASAAIKNVTFLKNEVVRLPTLETELYAAGYPYVALTPRLGEMGRSSRQLVA